MFQTQKIFFAPIIPQRGCNVKGNFKKRHNNLNKESFTQQWGFQTEPKRLFFTAKGFQRGNKRPKSLKQRLFRQA